MRKWFTFCIALAALLGIAFAGPASADWERKYGADDHLSKAYSVEQTPDDGYIVAGYTTLASAIDEDVYLVKTNASGVTLWSRTYQNPNDGNFCESIQLTPDGGYILGGYRLEYSRDQYDVYLLKTNASGDTLWSRTYGSPTGNETAYSLEVTSDSGYVIAGTTRSVGPGTQADVWLIKTKANGDTLWTRTYGGPYDDFGYSVKQTSDGGYIVTGVTDYWGPDPQVYLIKTNASGNALWTRTYGPAGTYPRDIGWDVLQTSDGGYVVAGETAGGRDIYLVKTNASGNALWTRTYSVVGGNYVEQGLSVQQTRDGSYLVGGQCGPGDLYVMKTNAAGDTLRTWTFNGGGSGGEEEGNCIRLTRDGGCIVAGWSGSGSWPKYYLVKIEGVSGVESANDDGRKLEVGLKTAPNPFVSFASVPGHERERFALYDISGRKVGIYRGDRIGAGLEAGVYFLKAEGKDAKPVRIVKIR